MKRLITIIYIYQFIMQAFSRSFVSLLTANNYNTSFRYHILMLEIWFLVKATCNLVFQRQVFEEKFFGYTMQFPNYLEFVLLFIEIFGIQEYRLQTTKSNPTIVDCGSGWGMSVLYFKHWYPNARIIAVEANKGTAMSLRENIRRNHITRVIVRTAFVAGTEGKRSFYIQKGLNGWSVSDTGASDTVSIHSDFTKTMTRSIALSSFIPRGVDVVKLDIEGIEGEALASARKELTRVGEVVIEYHPSMNRRHNSLSSIQKILGGAGFQVSIRNTKYLFPTKNALSIIHAFRE